MCFYYFRAVNGDPTRASGKRRYGFDKIRDFEIRDTKYYLYDTRRKPRRARRNISNSNPQRVFRLDKRFVTIVSKDFTLKE